MCRGQNRSGTSSRTVGAHGPEVVGAGGGEREAKPLPPNPGVNARRNFQDKKEGLQNLKLVTISDSPL